jgi:hypothetical protein
MASRTWHHDRHQLLWAVRLQERIENGDEIACAAWQAACEARSERGRERRHRNREDKPHVRVVDPARGEIIVRAGSNFDAIEAAAEEWGCDWLELRDARVWRLEPENEANHDISGGH